MRDGVHDYTILLRPDKDGYFVAYVEAIDGSRSECRMTEEAREDLGYMFGTIAEESGKCVAGS